MQSEALPNVPCTDVPNVTPLARSRFGDAATLAARSKIRPHSFVPRAVMAAGLSQRYRYWRGRSGKSYLFTRIDRSTVEDFPGAIVLLANGDEIAAVGQFSADADNAILAREPGVDCYVHLLAETSGGRAEVLEDLAASAPVHPLTIAA